MPAMGVEPNVFTYTTLIGAFDYHGWSGNAAAWIERMIHDGVRPNQRTWLAVHRIPRTELVRRGNITYIRLYQS